MEILAGIRSRLILLACAVATPMLVLQFMQAAAGREEAIARAGNRVSELARLILAEQDESLQAGADLLKVLKRVPGVIDVARGECHGLLKAITNEHPRINTLTLTRADGSISCTSAQPVPPPVSFADRPWFRQATASDAPDIVISSVLLSRVTHLPSVIVATALGDDPGRAPVGTIAASMSLAWFSGFVAPLPDLGGVTVRVIDAQTGLVQACSKGAAPGPGLRFADAALLPLLRSQLIGQTEATGPDGIRRIIAFRRLPGDQSVKSVLAVDIPLEAVLAEANHHLMQGLSVTALMLLLGMAAAWSLASISITRPLDALGFAAHRLGQGDLAVRATMPDLGVREFRRLGEMFNSAIAQFYGFLNLLRRDREAGEAGAGAQARGEALRALTVLIAPFTPHLAESAWERLGGPERTPGFVADAPWPTYDPALAQDEEKVLPVQINGKRRAEIRAPAGAGQEVVEAIARADADVLRHLDGLSVRKVIVVPDRIVNIVAA